MLERGDALGENGDTNYLRNIAHEFQEGINSRDLDRVMRFYGETYVDVNLRHPVQTKAERRNYYAHIIEQRPGFRLRVETDEVLIRGDIALIRGTIVVNQTADNAPKGSRTELRYLEVAERTRSGDWRVIWGMDGPVQEYESQK
jgi:ketosteroid isomerase-like protein